jgi:hypothetical protein
MGQVAELEVGVVAEEEHHIEIQEGSAQGLVMRPVAIPILIIHPDYLNPPCPDFRLNISTLVKCPVLYPVQLHDRYKRSARIHQRYVISSHGQLLEV